MNLDTLCPKARNCKRAFELKCQLCDTVWAPEDIKQPGLCPKCQAFKYIRQQCSECPTVKLNEAMNNSPTGALLGQIGTLASLLEKPGAALTMRDIDQEEWNALQILWSEQDRRNKREK